MTIAVGEMADKRETAVKPLEIINEMPVNLSALPMATQQDTLMNCQEIDN